MNASLPASILPTTQPTSMVPPTTPVVVKQPNFFVLMMYGPDSRPDEVTVMFVASEILFFIGMFLNMVFSSDHHFEGEVFGTVQAGLMTTYISTITIRSRLGNNSPPPLSPLPPLNPIQDVSSTTNGNGS